MTRKHVNTDNWKKFFYRLLHFKLDMNNGSCFNVTTWPLSSSSRIRKYLKIGKENGYWISQKEFHNDLYFHSLLRAWKKTIWELKMPFFISFSFYKQEGRYRNIYFHINWMSGINLKTFLSWFFTTYMRQIL